MEKRTVLVPGGDHCMRSNMKPCIMASYAKHLGAYNCRLYGRLLKGEKFPRKCAECMTAVVNKEEPVRHGMWVCAPEAYKLTHKAMPDDIVCTSCYECFNTIDNNVETFDYCPHCGAKMDGGVADA